MLEEKYYKLASRYTISYKAEFKILEVARHAKTSHLNIVFPHTAFSQKGRSHSICESFSFHLQYGHFSESLASFSHELQKLLLINDAFPKAFISAEICMASPEAGQLYCNIGKKI